MPVAWRIMTDLHNSVAAMTNATWCSVISAVLLSTCLFYFMQVGRDATAGWGSIQSKQAGLQQGVSLQAAFGVPIFSRAWCVADWTATTRVCMSASLASQNSGVAPALVLSHVVCTVLDRGVSPKNPAPGSCDV